MDSFKAAVYTFTLDEKGRFLLPNHAIRNIFGATTGASRVLSVTIDQKQHQAIVTLYTPKEANNA